MKQCKDCNVKDFYARAFDLHWLDEYDCPVICPYIQDISDYTVDDITYYATEDENDYD